MLAKAPTGCYFMRDVRADNESEEDSEEKLRRLFPQ
jgi:hypothetical protein